MRAAVRMSQVVETTLRADNFRSEHRWERQLVDALLQNGSFSAVHSIETCHRAGAEKPVRFVDGLAGDASDVVAFSSETQDLGWHVTPKAWFLNFYSYRRLMAGEETHSKLMRLKDAYGNRLVLFYPYQDHQFASRWGRAELGPALDAAQTFPDSFEELCMPLVPEVSKENGFDRKILLVPARHILTEVDVAGDDWAALFAWAAQKMSGSDLELHLMTGYEQADFDFRGWRGTLDEMFWEQPSARSLLPVRDHVRLHMGMGWDRSLDLFSKAKLVLGVLAGGSAAVEAAAYGVPFVSIARSGPMKDGVAVTQVEGEHLVEQALPILDRLFGDRKAYDDVADRNREFVALHYSYMAFNFKLNEILHRRGIL